MSTQLLIERRKPIPNRWRIRDDEDPATGDTAPVVAGDIVTLARWRALRAETSGSADVPSPIGVLLAPGDEPRELGPDLHAIALIAIDFPIFTDGRGYSTARLLRQQLGYEGALLATGDVLRDQLLLLERCGFDTFRLREDQDIAAALSAFDDFSDAYQGNVPPVPLFARRHASPEKRA